MQNIVQELLSDHSISPVLMDIGASIAPPAIWNSIAPISIYIGFDPDLREMHEERSGRFRRSVIVNQAVVAADMSEVTFYLTRSPFCSSVLKPAPELAAGWLCRHHFEVERTVSVQATTIDAALKRAGVANVDWLKLDAQGMDLTLFNSIRADARARVLALDVEPGFVECYRQQDLLVDVDHDLSRNGFWLATVNMGGFIRMRRETLEAARATIDSRITDEFINKAVKTSPAYLEARYLRTIEWLSKQSLGEREYVLLWAFAATDLQFGFCLDLAFEVERVFGASDRSQKLKAATWSLIQRSHRRRQLRRASDRIRKSVIRFLRRIV